MSFVDLVESRLPKSIATAYRRCLGGPSQAVAELKLRTDTYLDELRARAEEEEFLDLETAVQVATGCHALLGHLGEDKDAERVQAVQAAVEYFVLEDDAEDDNSLVGMDDDLQVVVVTAQVLGWELPGVVV